jgi:hypothetical protein
VTPPLVRVSWLEHYVSVEDKWYDDEMVGDELAGADKPLQTVGYLVKETATHLVLVDTVGADGLYSRPWMIAKGVVTERLELLPAQRVRP